MYKFLTPILTSLADHWWKADASPLIHMGFCTADPVVTVMVYDSDEALPNYTRGLTLVFVTVRKLDIPLLYYNL